MVFVGPVTPKSRLVLMDILNVFRMSQAARFYSEKGGIIGKLKKMRALKRVIGFLIEEKPKYYHLIYLNRILMHHKLLANKKPTVKPENAEKTMYTVASEIAPLIQGKSQTEILETMTSEDIQAFHNYHKSYLVREQKMNFLLQHNYKEHVKVIKKLEASIRSKRLYRSLEEHAPELLDQISTIGEEKKNDTEPSQRVHDIQSIIRGFGYAAPYVPSGN